MALLELRNLHKRFGPLVVLDGVDLDIEAGQTTVVLGPSGTGKSVLLKHIVGLLKPDQGEVRYRYRQGKMVNISKLDDYELADVRKDFGFCFQMGALFDSISAGENVAFPLFEHTTKKRDEIRRIAEHKLAMVGLPNVYEKAPSQLSGGQRKRVALARAIALNPRLVLYDEPTTGLDPITSDVINEVIIKLKQELHVTSVVVTHDMVSTFKVADRIVMLRAGKVIADGTPSEIRRSRDDNVRRFIEGRAENEDLAALKATRETMLTRSWIMDSADAPSLFPGIGQPPGQIKPAEAPPPASTPPANRPPDGKPGDPENRANGG